MFHFKLFQDIFKFTILFRDLAFLRLTVTDISTNHVTAQRVIPINYLRPGYRYVRLNNNQNQPLPLSSVFIHTKFEEEGFDVVHTRAPTTPMTIPVKDNLMSAPTKDNLEQTESTSILLSPTQEEKVESGVKRRMFFLIVYGIQNIRTGGSNPVGAMSTPQNEEDPYVILKVTQECTTETVICKVLSKLSSVDGAYNLQLHDYLLLEEVNRGWEASDKLLPPLQRILDAQERPLEAQGKWKGEGRFIIRRIGDDPSSRAWLSSILNSSQKLKSRKVYYEIIFLLCYVRLKTVVRLQ